MRFYLHRPARSDYFFAAALAVGWPLCFWLVEGAAPNLANWSIWGLAWPATCLAVFCVGKR